MKISVCFIMFFMMGLRGFTQSDFATIRARVRVDLFSDYNSKTSGTAVRSLMSGMGSNGCWKDVDYADRSATKWAPTVHLERVKDMAMALVKKDQPYFGHVPLHKAVVAALRYWYAADPKSGNWWHNDIATPQKLGEIIILLKDAPWPLPAPLEDSLVNRMKRGDPYEKTGANKLDIAIHYIYRACITENPHLMDSAVDQAFQPIVLTTEEGLQHDNSYLQHGPQLQISSYGLVFLDGEYRVASLVNGTRYELPLEKRRLLGQYLMHTFLPAIRGRYIDFNTEGRGVSRPDILDKRRLAGKRGLLQLAAALHPLLRPQIDAAIQRIVEVKPASFKVKPVHTHYWKGDYTQHLRSSYSLNVRTVSLRTKRTESGNRENLLGTFLPDGSTNIQRRGGEYYNIMPVWEWDKIPGITSRDFTTDQPMVVQWGENGSTSFVGGVSDSLFGATVYDMHYYGVRAKKAWFFFDKEVVCLGAGIHSGEKEEVVTTINQCWKNGPAYVWTDGQLKELGGQSYNGAMDGVWHDSIGYFFSEKQMLSLSTQMQKGSWSQINDKTSVQEVSGQVFKLWKTHGVMPQSASYAYVVVPGIAVRDMNKGTVQDVVILQNNASLQAVQHKALQMVQAIFYKPGELAFDDFAVSVDKPCTLLLKQKGNNLQVHISDPAQKEESITLTIKKTSTGRTKKLHAALPQGTSKGASVAMVLAGL